MYDAASALFPEILSKYRDHDVKESSELYQVRWKCSDDLHSLCSAVYTDRKGLYDKLIIQNIFE